MNKDEARREYHRQYYLANKERMLAQNKAWRERNPERLRALNKDWALRNPDKTKRYRKQSKLRAKYGVDLEHFEEVLRKQGGVCAICGDEDPTDLDHCHKTGRERGIICHRCNKALGLLRDDVPTLQGAIEYLNKPTG